MLRAKGKKGIPKTGGGSQKDISNAYNKMRHYALVFSPIYEKPEKEVRGTIGQSSVGKFEGLLKFAFQHQLVQ